MFEFLPFLKTFVTNFFRYNYFIIFLQTFNSDVFETDVGQMKGIKE